ncbi:hypothetical protein CMI37_11885 [Candidatus Pacearchaeota archaeon]|nr:hypothetical protein [Candidatus Pacearchaeota archaeon]|tara:strand:- start:1610 stop:2764 length:1155 start_codon:yes stop_codon:yes gene_type:complete
MKLKLKNTPEQVELIKAMGSKNQLESREAQEAFAAFLGPVIQKVILQAGTAGAIYSDSEYDDDDSPSYPLDLYYNEGAGYVTVWSQHMAGGLPSSEVTGVSEMKIATYRLDSAVSFNKRYARRSRLEIISRAVERMAQEVLVKQERNAWAVILKALAEGSSDLVSGTTLQHAFSSGAASGSHTFDLDMMNSLLTRMKRIGESFAGGTPDPGNGFGITDLYTSPEVMEKLRSMSYQHISRGSDTLAVTRSQVNNVTENVRNEIWNSAGMASIWGVVLHELIEFGVGHKYNTLFDEMAGATTYKDAAGANALAFAATDEVLVGVDASKGAFIRAIARNADTGGTFQALPDDQWNLNRLDKAGFYGSLDEGRVCIDSRAVAGLILKA